MRTNFSNVFYIENLDGSNGFSIIGDLEKSELGIHVSNAGDLNKDGIEDLIISLSKGYFIIYGQKTFPPQIFIHELNGENGFSVRCDDSSSSYPSSGFGDYNNDFIDDFALAFPLAHLNGKSNVGKVLIITSGAISYKTNIEGINFSYQKLLCDFNSLRCTDNDQNNYNQISQIMQTYLKKYFEKTSGNNENQEKIFFCLFLIFLIISLFELAGIVILLQKLKANYNQIQSELGTQEGIIVDGESNLKIHEELVVLK